MRIKLFINLFIMAILLIGGCAPIESEIDENSRSSDVPVIEETKMISTSAETESPTEIAPTDMLLQLITQTASVPADSVKEQGEEEESGVQIDEEKAAALQMKAKELYEKGLLGSYQGNYSTLEDFDQVWAQRGWFQWWSTGYNPKNFILRGNAAWDSDEADPRPEAAYSGCGIVFRATSESSFYVVYLGLDGRAHLHVFNGNSPDKQGSMAAERFGENGLSGSARFMLVVEDDWFTFYVDDERILQASAQTHKKGGIALTLLSGTNKGYGTHCRMSDLELWALSDTDNEEIEDSNDMPYFEGFENGAPEDWLVFGEAWQVEEEDGNHYWLASGNQIKPQAWLDPGTSHWSDYAFQSRVRFDVDGSLFICARTSTDGDAFYSAYLDSQKDYISIIDYNRNAPEGIDFQVFGETSFELDAGIWYTVRLEVQHNVIRFYIDNDLVSMAERDSWSEGGVAYYMEPGNQIALDDIRIWSLQP